MASSSQAINSAGIYLIRHKLSGMSYVGQANNLHKRWEEHRQQLKAGKHHNKGLRELWLNSSEDDFEFEIARLAPSGLSPLQLQRWLVKEEREIYVVLKEKDVALNEAEPEIVATDDAVREHRIQAETSNKQFDHEISTARRVIKKKLEGLEREFRTQAQYLQELRKKYDEKNDLIKNSTGWKRLLLGRSPCLNLEEERKKLGALVLEINRISLNVNRVQEQISCLRKENRHLYHQFTKIAERRFGRALWYGLGKLPQKPTITE